MQRGRGVPGTLAALILVTCTICLPSLGQTPLTPIAGSPFLFTSGGKNSNIVALSVDESLLFVSNQASASVTVLQVASDGTLTLQGVYPSTPAQITGGIALNPAGYFLYTATGGAQVNTHYIDADGTLYQTQSAPLNTSSYCYNGIAYVSLNSGDYLYVNNDAVFNTISVLKVNPADGSLGPAVTVSTGGRGTAGDIRFAAPTLVAGSDQRLYALNVNSADITVFNINSNGSLTAVPGSPFHLPAFYFSSGSIAISPDANYLYAGSNGGAIVRFRIDPNTGILSVVDYNPISINGGADGLAASPNGSAVVGVYYGTGRIAALDAATMRNLPGSPLTADSPDAAGALFNAAGTLFFSGAVSQNTRVSVYTVNIP